MGPTTTEKELAPVEAPRGKKMERGKREGEVKQQTIDSVMYKYNNIIHICACKH